MDNGAFLYHVDIVVHGSVLRRIIPTITALLGYKQCCYWTGIWRGRARARPPSLARSLAQSGSSFPRALRRGFWFPPDGSVRWLCLAEPRAGLLDFSLALSFCNRSPPPPSPTRTHTHTHTETRTHLCRRNSFPRLCIYIFSLSQTFPSLF